MKTAVVLLLAGAVVCAADEAAGVRAFRDVARVLLSPRCVNCHVAPDSPPLQGDDSHVHAMKVSRGADGSGTSAAMRCSTCHQEENAPAPHAPPGAHQWRMPPASTAMAWYGLTTAQVCQAIKDPSTNGRLTLAQLVEHVRSEALVNWAWNPGPNRTLPPLSHRQFVEAFEAWVAAGAPCPR